jgi:hypothetical protein
MSMSPAAVIYADDREAGFAHDLDRAFDLTRFPTPSSM